MANRWSILILLFAVRTGIGLQYQVIGSLSPLFIAGFSIGIAEIGLLIGLYHAPGTVLAIPGGAIAARLGDKRVVLVGLLLMIIGELAPAIIPAWPLQIVGRLCAGSGSILLNVVMTKMVTDWFAGRKIATAMAIFGIASPCGIAFALVTLPTIAAAGGRTLASEMVAVYLMTALLALALLYRAPPHAAPKGPRQTHWPDRRVLWAMTGAGVVYGLYNVSLVAVIGFGPLMLTERGWTIVQASSATSLALWLFAFSVPLGGIVSDRMGSNPALLIGGLAAFAAALVLASRVDMVLPAFVLIGIISGLPCGPVMSLPAAALSAETRGVGMGVFFAIYYLVNLCGPWFIGCAAEFADGARAAFDLGAAFLCIGIAVWAICRHLLSSSVTVPVR
jgi:MFS family permease